jgi:murein DD-endopeptidase MepM/ murein hydrolase activator NlpD
MRRRLAPRALAAVLALASYAPPVDAPIADRFRPPATPYGPGNRGVDYATPPGTPVLAAGPGMVTFAGQVGGARHVVVLHGDGVRTSYSFLSDVAVRRGDDVDQGTHLGTTGTKPLHFGARVGDQYIDPLSLFARVRVRVRLLPDDGKGLPPAAKERGALERLVRGLASTAPRLLVPASVLPLRAAPLDPSLTPLVSALAARVPWPDPRLAVGVALTGGFSTGARAPQRRRRPCPDPAGQDGAVSRCGWAGWGRPAAMPRSCACL